MPKQKKNKAESTKSTPSKTEEVERDDGGVHHISKEEIDKMITKKTQF